MWSLHTLSDAIGKAFGVPGDNVLGLLAILLSYVEAGIFMLLPDSVPVKSAFSVAASFLAMWQLFDIEGAVHLISAVAYTWLISRFLGGRNGALLTFAAVMLHLAYNHLHRQVFVGLSDYRSFDHTAPFMVLAIKLTSYGFSVWDGTRPASELTPHQAKKAIKDVPDLLSFAGYAFFFGGFLAGPAFDFADYRLFCEGHLAPGPIRGALWPTLRCFGYGIGTLALFLLLGDYSFEATRTERYAALSPWGRYMFLSACGFQARTKFYTAWKLAEGACVMIGLGWNGVEEVDDGRGGKRKKVRWDRVSNVHPSKIETATSWSVLVRNWNINTQSWLENHIYRRCTTPELRGWGMLATYAVSAFWHGFYPGYYLFFFSAAITTSVAANVRRAVRPFFLPPSPYAGLKPAYDLLTWFASLTVLNYMAASFMLLSLSEARRVWGSVYFAPHVAIAAAYAFFALGGGRWLAGVQRRMGIAAEKPKRATTGDLPAPSKGAAEAADVVAGKGNGVSANGAAGVRTRSSAQRAD
ncbi:MBOAT, membrane-bound O-acyltransferase family-domain-containing protein [Hyaloraphidium curvatum]|nr:MBOAT, membrane-bound O-acyltransferase family-domain-containing protein [Hyaloraphidium curvatum]